jgi:hypothetical protein
MDQGTILPIIPPTKPFNFDAEFLKRSLAFLNLRLKPPVGEEEW